MPGWRASPPARRPTPRRGSPTRYARRLYVNLELIAVARDGACRRLHDGHGAPCFCGGHRQRLVPGHVVGEVAIEAVHLSSGKRDELIVRPAAFRGAQHFHTSGEIRRHWLIAPLADDRAARAEHVPLRFHRGGDVRLQEARLGSVREGEVHAHLVGVGDVVPYTLVCVSGYGLHRTWKQLQDPVEV